MRKSMVCIAAIAALCFMAGTGRAETKLTEDQVRTTCGTLMVDAGSHFGCKKNCGDGKTCGFSCEKGGKNCSGSVVERHTPTTGLPAKKPRPGAQATGGVMQRQ